MNKTGLNQAAGKKWYIWLFVAILGALLLSTLASDFIKNMFFSLLAGLTPIIVACVLAFLLLTPMNYIERVLFKNLFTGDAKAIKKKRALSLTIIYLLVVILIVLIMWLTVPSLVETLSQLLNNLNHYIDTLKSELTSLIQGLSWFNEADVQNTIDTWVNDFAESLSENAPIILKDLLRTLTNVVGIIISTLFGVLLSFFLLKNKEKINETCKRYTYAYNTKPKADEICDITRKTNSVLNAWVSGNIIISTVLFIITYVGLLIIGVPKAGLLSLVLSILTVIPYVGGFIAIALIGLLALAFTDAQITVVAVVFSFAAWAIITTVLPPFVFSKKLKLNVGVIFFTLVIGGSLFGIWGMLLTGPAVAVIQTVAKQRLEQREARNAQAAAESAKEEPASVQVYKNGAAANIQVVDIKKTAQKEKTKTVKKENKKISKEKQDGKENDI